MKLSPQQIRDVLLAFPLATTVKLTDTEAVAAVEAVLEQVPETVTLREWDFEVGQAGAFVDRAYPAKVIAEFVNWLRETKAWWEDVEMVHRKVVRLNQRLAELRQNEKERHLVLLAAETTPVTEQPPVADLEAARKARQLEGAARGRATAAANRAAKKLAAGGS